MLTRVASLSSKKGSLKCWLCRFDLESVDSIWSKPHDNARGCFSTQTSGAVREESLLAGDSIKRFSFCVGAGRKPGGWFAAAGTESTSSPGFRKLECPSGRGWL